MATAQPIETRFWPKVDVRGPDECWPWTASADRRGYGFFWPVRYATHASLIIDGRPRPSPAHQACHRCDNPNCVNPAHLWWGTCGENMRDALSKGRGMAAKLKSQTHCKRGHPRTEANIKRHGRWRECKVCDHLRAAIYRSRKKDASHAA